MSTLDDASGLLLEGDGMRFDISDVENARQQYNAIMYEYLTERGWSVDEGYCWSKDGAIGMGTLTDEEACYYESTR